MFDTKTKPEIPIDTTKKAEAIAMIRAAEVALAVAQASVAEAVAHGELQPCQCLTIPFAAAQGAMEDVRDRVNKRKGDRTEKAKEKFAEALLASILK
ncbi:MAG: hypothetical protein AAFV46_00800 [Cyanobacteria bacterium J06635_11]